MSQTIRGRLVLENRITPGTIVVEDELISHVELNTRGVSAHSPLLAPGFVDVHVHGWGGHDAMGDAAALDGMARALLRHGVTSFLPTAVTAPIPRLADFAAQVRAWAPDSPADGAQPLGFNLEGPFLSRERKGAHDPAFLRIPADVTRRELSPLTDELRVITVAPELPGAVELITWLEARGVAVSVGHSAATIAEARAAYDAGAMSTTHLFNAMTGVDHRAPGVALAALLDEDIFVELIADGVHVDRALWPLITRLKSSERLLLVSDAISLAGTGDGHGRIGTLEVDVRGDRVTLSGTETLAGSVLSLDVAVRNLADSGVTLPRAVAAASRNPLALLGIDDRGRIAPGQRADLVELATNLSVTRVMRAGTWIEPG
jgi:N-acetylglucosamine-6-phosphate deacetylase